MASKSERHVLFFDLKITAASRSRDAEKYDGLTPLTGQKIFQLIANVLSEDRKILSVAKRTKQVYVQDITVEPKWAKLLINISDQDAADPTIANAVKNTRRRVTRKPEEGVEGSLHMVVNLTPVHKNIYTAVIECTPGLPASRVQKLLNLYVRLAKTQFPDEFMVNDPSGALTKTGEYKKISVSNKLELFGQPSKQLEQDINSGTLSGLELIQYKDQKANWDEEGYITSRSYITSLGVKPIDRPGIRPWQLLTQCFKKALAVKASQVRIRFKTASGLHRTVLIDPETEKAIDEEHYVRKEVLSNFSVALESAYATMNTELIDKLKRCAR